VTDQPVSGPAAPAPTASPVPAAPAGAATAAPVSDDGRIGIEQFMSVELRVARVLAAERVAKSKKLMQLRIDAGSEERTIVAGIAEAYEPEPLVGRLIVIVANLKPAKLMGIESNGMVLASSGEGGKPVLVAPGEGAAPGDRVR
jgi:methionyl-tRNA synthetase